MRLTEEREGSDPAAAAHACAVDGTASASDTCSRSAETLFVGAPTSIERYAWADRNVATTTGARPRKANDEEEASETTAEAVW